MNYQCFFEVQFSIVPVIPIQLPIRWSQLHLNVNLWTEKESIVQFRILPNPANHHKEGVRHTRTNKVWSMTHWCRWKRVVVAKRNNSCWQIGVIVVCFYRDSVPSAYMMSFIRGEGSEMPQLPCEVTENVKQHCKQDNWLNVNPVSTGIRTVPESITTLESDTHAHKVSDVQEDKMGTVMIHPSQSCHFSQSTGTQRGPRETNVAQQSIP